jgi:hypothetical protein
LVLPFQEGGWTRVPPVAPLILAPPLLRMTLPLEELRPHHCDWHCSLMMKRRAAIMVMVTTVHFLAILFLRIRLSRQFIKNCNLESPLKLYAFRRFFAI